MQSVCLVVHPVDRDKQTIRKLPTDQEPSLVSGGLTSKAQPAVELHPISFGSIGATWAVGYCFGKNESRACLASTKRLLSADYIPGLILEYC